MLYSATYQGYYFLSLTGILVSVISCVYYLKIIKIIFSDIDLKSIKNPLNNTKIFILNTLNKNINSNSSYRNINYEPVFVISNFHSFLISFLTLLILFFIFKPALILSSTQLFSLLLFKT